MANGDDAAAAGMPTVAPTADRRLGYDEINLTRDLIAQRTSAVTPIVKGGTGSTTAAAARAALGARAAGDVPWSEVSGKPSSYPPSTHGHAATEISIGSTNVQTAVFNTLDGLLNPSVYNRALSGSYRVAYVGADGTLGWVSSSQAAKEDIRPALVDVAAVLAADVVTYHRIGAPDDAREHGLIAEALHDLGLTWLVDYGPEGDTPQGVRYDLLALALLPALQAAHARLDAIETHLDALGGELDAPTY